MLFHSRLKKARLEKGLKQCDVSDKLFISRSVITEYEKGTVNPSCQMLIELAKLLDVSSDYLLGLSDFKKNSYDDDNYLDHLRKAIDLLESSDDKTEVYIKDNLKLLLKLKENFE